MNHKHLSSQFVKYFTKMQEIDDLGVEVRQRKPPLQRQITESDFTCGCCYDLMVQPTTLTCGHSFCRLCLAAWYNQSKKRECPQCRQAWSGIPKINFTLRNLSIRACEEKLREREEVVCTQENKRIIYQFETALQSSQAAVSNLPGNLARFPQGNAQINNAQIKNFCTGILLMGAVVLFLYLAWYWRNSDEDLLTKKPAHRWNIDDVGQWLFNLGEWAEPYSEVAKEKRIDGRLMLALDREHLHDMLNVTNVLHQTAILESIKTMKEQGMKSPDTLWEYKSKYPGKSLFILYGLKDFPRALMLYLYFMEYDSIFLPFMTTIKWKSLTDEERIIAEMDDRSTRQYLIDFVPAYVLLPYQVVGRFTWGYLSIHYWVSRLVILNCVLLTCLEAMMLRAVFRFGMQYIHLKEVLWMQTKAYLKSVISMVVFMIFWPVIPSIICDCFFYGALYFSPFYNLHKVKKGVEV